MGDDEQTLAASGEGHFGVLVDDLRGIISTGRGRAAAAVNAEMVRTYWHIGERIVREEQGGASRAGYGEQLLARLGRTLGREFGRGFTETNLRMMRQFHLAYPNQHAVRVELSWTHYRALMRLPDERRSFYEQAAIASRWSSRELERQINNMLYERVGLSKNPTAFLASQPRGETGLAPFAGAFKDPYVLDFLGLEDTFSEKDLEAALIRNIEKFLLELGTGFCFVGRQYRMPIGGRDYIVDLVFFHKKLRASVLVDLKVGAFTPADAAQMKLYLNWFRANGREPWEEEPIGLILCGSADEQVVQWLFADPETTIDERIKVAQYLLLDTEDTLKKRLAQLTAMHEQLAEHERSETLNDGR